MSISDDLTTTANLGLALGGGGALGVAHVGVLQVLRERGIRPTHVAGTSAGAIVGAAYAYGLDPYELEQRVVHASWSTFGTFTPRPGLGFLTADALRQTVRDVAGEALIEDLPIPFGAVATEVDSREVHVITTGPVAEALAASIAVPGIFRPVRIGKHWYVDGGVVQNLPIEAAFGLGADHVIGVRLAPEWDGPGLEPTTLKVHEWSIRADVTLIKPIVENRSQWVVRDLPTLVEIGRAAAEKVLADYPIVNPPPERPTPEDPPEDEEKPSPLRGVARFLHRH